ncbi:MAG: 4-alpha-glucanotransferase [Luteolibacter sp.]
MKIVFRVRYRTVPGQSLWLKLLNLPGGAVEVPMNWLNDQQWEIPWHIEGGLSLEYYYHYQLRQENGVLLDEWHVPRRLRIEEWGNDLMLVQDTWCSAGTTDYALETKAFRAFLPERNSFNEPAWCPGANHSFTLRAAGVPTGQVPCLIGDVPALGGWDLEKALPMVEISANQWQVKVCLNAAERLEYKYGWYDLESRRAVSLELWENRTLEPHAWSERQWTCVSDECFRRDPASLFRAAGVAIPVFSLRSEKGLGVGEFADLKIFGDWAAKTGMKLVQILPVNDTTSSHDWTDSYPYSAISVFALHPIYLRISDLPYLMPHEFSLEMTNDIARLNALDQIDYPQVMAVKRKLTREIFEQHHESILSNATFRDFLRENREWLVPYAVFCVKRDQFGTADFTKWQDWAWFNRERIDALMEPTHPDWPEVFYHLWLQYELDGQLRDAVAYLHERGLALKGDLPIGIDRESVDAWCSPHLFKMDSQAGAPPDAFAVKGQNWGFPTYHWDAMRKDNYAWWRSRFTQLSRYFDAYRIDHVLGFFRIWQVPYEQVDGIMGWFDPAIPIDISEFPQRGIEFDFNRFCKPYIREEALWERFGDFTKQVRAEFLEDCGYGYYQLREHVSTQRKIVDWFAQNGGDDFLKTALLDCVADVLFFPVPGTDETKFHPRCSLQMTRSFLGLDPDQRWKIEELYNDYFYQRQESFWQAQGYEKLPAMRHASEMLLCGEDLGMVPACVPGVMKELGILSLEIQRMPKMPGSDFFHPAQAPYLSVVSPSTHDMSTLRAWWREDPHQTSKFARQMLGLDFPPSELSADLATRIIDQHLASPAMWAIFPLQDLLATSDELRHPAPETERINVPAIMPYYWRYRMHVGMETLLAAETFNREMHALVAASGRVS